MKAKIKNILNVLMIHILLFSLIGCDYYGTWQLEVVNNLSHPITVRITGKNDSRNTLASIQPRKSASIWLSSKTPSEANEGIRKISVFSDKRRMLMILEGEQLNQYVILKGQSIEDILEGREPRTRFSFEVKEEHIGFDLDNVMSSSANKNEDVDILDIEELYAND